MRRPSGEEPKKQPLPTFLVRLVNGRDLFTILAGTHATHLDHDELRTQAEVDLVGGFLQGMRDYLDIWDDIEPAERVQVTFVYNHQIEELARSGFWVFGSRQRKRIRFGDRTTGDWEVAIITIHRSDNPSIIRLGPERAVIAAGALWLGVISFSRGQFWLGVCFVGLAMLRAFTLFRAGKPSKREPESRLDITIPSALRQTTVKIV